MRHPFVLHVDIDAFFAAVEVMLNPALRGKPVIIGGMPDERGVVSTASYEARKYGVHSGMALRTAGQKCPQGVFLRGRYHVYSQTSERFMEVLRRFSPRVEVASIDEAYMDLSGMRYLYPSVVDLAHQIKSTVEGEIGVRVSMGVGFSRLGAKLATEVAKPGNIFFVGDEKEFISNLALEKIPGIGRHTLLILQGLGIRRVKELRTAYPAIWKRTIAPHIFSGSRYPERQEPRTKSFSRETTFPEDISDRDLIAAHLAYLVDRLSVYLIENKYYAGRIEVKVRFSDFSTFTKRMPLDFPTYSYHNMWKPVLFLLNELLKKKKLPLRLVGVKVEDISKQRDILPFVSLKNEKLSNGVTDVKKRFGFSSIFTARELLLEKIYPVERDGVVLKTASLTK
ncbi:MAG: DNA polymerase IV [Candidatus Aminicenantes bacterium]|nr:MAG: DNA polymerase IV [Candidatus Aminicenantes bacterium]